MYARSLPFFLTFVLIVGLNSTELASAAPDRPSPDFRDDPPAEEAVGANDFMKVEGMSITQPPFSEDVDQRELGYYHRFRKSLTARVGSMYDTKATDEGQHVPYLMGVQYQFPARDLGTYEAGFDLLSGGTGQVQASKVIVFSRTKFRPYAKAGVGLRIEPDDQMASFVKFENYQGRAAIGFERLTLDAMSLRVELELSISLRSVQGTSSLGYVWAW